MITSTSLAQRDGLIALESQLFEAIEKLSNIDVWCDMLAENILYSGGIERFFQRSLLWAFNTIEESRYWTAMEQSVAPLSNSQQLDFLIYCKTPEHIDEVCEDEKLPAHRWLDIGVAFCELKCVYNRATIDSDLQKFRAIAAETALRKREKKYFYELVIIWTYFYQQSEENCLRTFSALEDECWQYLKDVGIDHSCLVGERWLLQGRPNPSDGSMRTYFKVLLLVLPIINT